ncbi:MAG: hypothetical protein DHS20C05_19270 [Hyphococcus sp.]|nr:MAG: hypothetical protein DHS20C05_19270 [Marinicaulis sp.]
MLVEYTLALMMNDVREAAPSVAAFIRMLSGNQLFKGAILCALLVAAISRTGLKNNRADNVFIIRSVTAIFTSIFTARLLQLFLPHRDRPVKLLSDAGISEFRIMDSSFPSDHAVLMTTIACIIFARDRTIGIFAAVWAGLIILFPRIYLGVHHPTDIIGGILLGMLVWYVVRLLPMPTISTTFLETLRSKHAALCAFLGFLFLFLMATNFDGLRMLASYLLLSILGLNMDL